MIRESNLVKAQERVSESFKLKFSELQKLSDAYNKEEDKIFTAALRVKAFPPIKGDITRAKIQWRGIKLNQSIRDGQAYRWLTQRGKIISPKVTVDMPNFNKIYK